MSGWFGQWLLPPITPGGVCVTTRGAASPEHLQIVPQLSAKTSYGKMQAQCSLLNTGIREMCHGLLVIFISSSEILKKYQIKGIKLCK